MRSWGTLLVIGAAITAVTALVPSADAAHNRAAVSPNTSWIDEFNGASGSLPSSANWSYDLGGGGWGNGEWQTYTNDPANIHLDGQGHLQITARKLWGSNGQPYYTSARISTRGKASFPYGTLAARIAVPRQKGLNPAFWMLGSDLPWVGYPACGEIDSIEAPDTSHSYFTLHGATTSGGNWSVGRGLTSSATDFHVYWVNHTYDTISLGVDGTTVGTLHKSDLPSNDLWVFNKGFDALLDMSVGGSFSGAPDSSTVFPATMTVDWVRYTS